MSAAHRTALSHHLLPVYRRAVSGNTPCGFMQEDARRRAAVHRVAAARAGDSVLIASRARYMMGGRRARGKVRPRRSPSGKFPSELGASCKLRGRVLSFPSPYDRMKKLKRGRNGIFPAATNLPRDADRRLCAARYRPWHLCGSILLKARTRRRLAARAVCACRALRSIVCPLLSADRWKWAIPVSRGGFAEPAARRSGAGGAARA